MITIVHGDDIASSRRYFVEQKNKEKNPIVFDGEKITPSDILQVLDGGSLFSENKLLFIEDFFSKKKPGKEFDDIVSQIQNLSDSQVFFWEGKLLTKRFINLFKNCEIKLFNIPKDIFTFLDSIYPDNKKSLIFFHNTLKTNEPELVFFMIIRQFRLLMAVSDAKTKEAIDEVKRLAPWQINKIKKQSGYFSSLKLKDCYRKLYELDLAQKTGALPYSLSSAIDIFLVDL